MSRLGKRLIAAMSVGWQSMESAPKDREILVRQHNGVFEEHDVVWWFDGDREYPWRAEGTAYPEGRLDEWHPIP